MEAASKNAPRVAIINYGMGNIGSVTKVMNRLGAKPYIADSPDQLEVADRIILPGVGAFGDGMENLRAGGFVDSLETLVIDGGVPFLGVCLGMELMAKGSEESPGVAGLGWIDADIVKFDSAHGLRIPHVGWNDISVADPDHPFIAGIGSGSTFYFVHSYYMACRNRDHIVAETDYGNVVASVVHNGPRIIGCQFHPEKSQDDGRRLLLNFLFGLPPHATH